MTMNEAKVKLTEVSDNLGSYLQTYLMTAQLDEDTKVVLDEVVRQMFNSFCESRDILIDYLESR